MEYCLASRRLDGLCILAFVVLWPRFGSHAPQNHQKHVAHRAYHRKSASETAQIGAYSERLTISAEDSTRNEEG